MTPEQTIFRGKEAQRFLDNPLVQEALEILEKEVVEQIHDCPVRDLEGLRILQMELRRVRKFRGIFIGVIERGKLAEHDLRERQTAVSRVRNMFRSGNARGNPE